IGIDLGKTTFHIIALGARSQVVIRKKFSRTQLPDAANRDMRQLLWHRHRLVQMRTRVMNQLHVVALNEGLRRKKALWRASGRQELESMALPPWATGTQIRGKRSSIIRRNNNCAS